MDRRLQRGAQIALRAQDADGVTCPISIPFEYDPKEFPFLRLCIRHLTTSVTGILQCIIHVAGWELDRTFPTILYPGSELVITVPAAGIRVAFRDLLAATALPCTIAYDVVPVKTGDYKEIPNIVAMDLVVANTAPAVQFAAFGGQVPSLNPYAVRTEMWAENVGGAAPATVNLYGTPSERGFVAAEAVQLATAVVAGGFSGKTPNTVIPAQTLDLLSYDVAGLAALATIARLRVIEWLRPF